MRDFDKYELYVSGVGYVGTCNTVAEARRIAKSVNPKARFTLRRR